MHLKRYFGVHFNCPKFAPFNTEPPKGLGHGKIWDGRNYFLFSIILHFLAKVLCFLRNFALTCISIAFPWEILWLLAKVLLFPKKMCSLAKCLHSLTKVMHSSKTFCIRLQMFVLPQDIPQNTFFRKSEKFWVCLRSLAKVLLSPKKFKLVFTFAFPCKGIVLPG